MAIEFFSSVYDYIYQTPNITFKTKFKKFIFVLLNYSSVVTKQNVTEWEITKTKVGNEMEIFITLTKYNTHQHHEEGKPLLVVYNLISILTPLSIVSNIFMRNGIYSLMLISKVYKIKLMS